MQFSDIYLNADEFFEILRYAWEKSEFFDGWDKRHHPEDLAVNIEVVLDSVTCGMVYYSHIISNNSRKSTLANDRVPVFGGTVPSDTFGDNV